VRVALSPSTDPSDYPFTHRIRTRFAETDAMGIIHHSAYVPYLEEARASLLRHAGHPYEQVRREGIDFAVLELLVRYRRPLRFDEQVDIHVMAGHLTRATFQVGYLMAVDGEARATAVTVHGAVDPTGRAVRMPPWLAGVIDCPVGPGGEKGEWA
jgi:acyl-CoA thioester hydrolase